MPIVVGLLTHDGRNHAVQTDCREKERDDAKARQQESAHLRPRQRFREQLVHRTSAHQHERGIDLAHR